jgi:hypothetical protein
VIPVFWTEGYLHAPPAMRRGAVVVRPDYVAFLPLGAGMSQASQFAHGFSSVFAQPARPDVSHTAYPLLAWWHRGPRAFDDAVWDAAARFGGLVVPVEQGAIVWKKYVPVTFTTTLSPAYVALEQPPPGDLIARWQPGVLPFARKNIQKTLLILVLGATLFAGCCEGLFYAARGALRLEPLGFVGFVVLLAVVAFALRAREHRADVSAAAAGSGAQAPYR